MSLPFDPTELVAQFRRFAWIIRHGPRERAAATVAGVLFLAGAWLSKIESLPTTLKDLSSNVSYGLYMVGGLLLVWVGYRIWRQAAPRPIIETPPPPTAVKGPIAFGPEDEALRSISRGL
jgi:threonine/homoserine/homoserine lactone efflux protein